MIIGVSGPQGSGKTTLLQALDRCGYNIDDFKVSRAVQAEMGFAKLTDVAVDMDTMIRFQERVFERKLENDRKVAEQPGIWIVERTFADIACYATWWWYQLSKHHTWKLDSTFEDMESVVWLADFVKKCHEAQKIYDMSVLLPFAKHIPVEADDQRADTSFSEWAFNQMQEFFQHTTAPTVYITEASVVGRAEEFVRKQFQETGTLVLPNVDSEAIHTAVHDAVEAAYWRFDALKKGYNNRTPSSERDAFKSSVYSVIGALLQSITRTTK